MAVLQSDFRLLYVVELTPDVSALTVALWVRYQLRAGDAIQLASYLHLQQRLGRPVQLVAYDTRLTEVARQEVLTLIP